MLTWNNVRKEILGGISLLELSWPSKVHTDEEGFRQEPTLELDLKYEWAFLPTERHPRNPQKAFFMGDLLSHDSNTAFIRRNNLFFCLPSIWIIYVLFFFFSTNWLLPLESRCEQDGDFCVHLGSNFSMKVQPVCLSIPGRKTYLWEKEAALSRQIIQCSSIFTFNNVLAGNSHQNSLFCVTERTCFPPFLATCSFLCFSSLTLSDFTRCSSTRCYI